MLSEEGENCHITFSVKDSGIGIPEDQLQYIFERFRQGESHTNRHFGGTGLGLSITKELVELQGGTITVKSIEAMGSLFSFTLPFKKPNEVYKIISSTHHELSSEEAKNLHVLVVEDNPINIKFITSLFAEYDINSFAPKVKDSNSTSSSPEEVNTIMGVDNFNSLLTMLIISIPPIKGIFKSSIIRSNLLFLICSTASTPFSTCIIL